MLLTGQPVLLLLLLLVLVGGPGCSAQNDAELSDPLSGTRYRIDGDGGTLVDLRTSLEP